MQKTPSRLTPAVFAVILFIGLAGCAGNRNNIQPALQQLQAKEEMVRHRAPEPSVSNDGSLWQAHNSLNVMFMDTKSRNIGDIVTVEIDESAKASNKANT